tara:strand:- start:13 stop:969 length:957 start_codon:yes stop_codon:yes gene_type:complete
MAIFRGGKRLGPFDIRVGLPRDKSLDRVDQDPRLKQQGNTENTMGRFRAAMASAEGYARTTRFAIRIFPPTNLESIIKNSQQSKGINIHGEGTDKSPNGQYMNSLSQTYGRQVNIHCDSISMPGHDLQTQSVQYGSAPAVDMVQAHAFAGQITASFYADKYLRERTFFEQWQKMAVNMVTHKANYYENYIGKMHIYQLGSFDGEGDRDVPTYGLEATEVYPATISAVDYNYAGNNIVKINVGFNYKQWFNLTTDAIAGMEFGSSKQTLHDIKGRGGIDGLIDKLPPEIARTGRSIFNQAKQQLPIGRITKGKIFPPFT